DCLHANSALHSFPTRRSSDLGLPTGVLAPSKPTCSNDIPFLSPSQTNSTDSMLSVLRWNENRRLLLTRHSMSPMSLGAAFRPLRSEEHTSELQSRFDLVCRLL